MKIALISFRNKYRPDCRAAEISALLRRAGVFADSEFLFDCGDEKSLITALGEGFDAFFIDEFNADFAAAEAVVRAGFDNREDGVYKKGNSAIFFVGNSTDEAAAKYKKFFAVDCAAQVFRLFGAEKKIVEKKADEISAKYPFVRFNVETLDMDSAVSLLFSESSPKIEADKAIKEFISAFKTEIYAEDDVTLEKQLVDLLRLRRLKITTAESMTGGAIAAKIVSVSGASDVFYEGFVTYNTEAKCLRLGVDPSTVSRYSVVSADVAFEMAKGLLGLGKADCAISVTGYACAPNEENKGYCFLGIGAEGDVRVYKYEFEGSRTEVISAATNAALYLMIKTIRSL